MSAAKPLPADRDRLLSRRIIDIRARSLFGDNLQDIIDMPTETRWRIAHADPDDEDDDTAVPPEVRKLLVEVMADVEAWIVVQRARKGTAR